MKVLKRLLQVKNQLAKKVVLHQKARRQLKKQTLMESITLGSQIKWKVQETKYLEFLPALIIAMLQTQTTTSSTVGAWVKTWFWAPAMTQTALSQQLFTLRCSLSAIFVNSVQVHNTWLSLQELIKKIKPGLFQIKNRSKIHLNKRQRKKHPKRRPLKRKLCVNLHTNNKFKKNRMMVLKLMFINLKKLLVKRFKRWHKLKKLNSL